MNLFPKRRVHFLPLLSLACGAGIGVLGLGTPGFAADRLPREELLLWRDSKGEVRPVRTPAEWEERRKEVVRSFERIAGPFPPESRRCDLDVTVEEAVDCGTFVRKKISYQSEPGHRVPAFLCIPKSVLQGQKRASAALCLHPTDSKVGHGVVVGVAGTSEHYLNRAYANDLAELGFVTIAPSYPLLANYQPDLDQLGYASGTMKAIWDNSRALDVLDATSGVESRNYAAIGHSLGGHNAVFTAVFDPRVRVVVSSCGLDSFLDYYDANPSVWKPEKGWCQKRYMPRLLDFAGRLQDIPFDFHELLGALAPRPVFINAPLQDSNFRWCSVNRVTESAREVYRFLGRPDALRVEHPDVPHDFPAEIRKQAYAFIQKGLVHEERGH
jgi:dienelactone hydrolase